ncbi:CU044_5270 family protein [Actinophytocola sp.]|uniref:CU044_5270 family protein n=1 Tax=Actinophytocola sp. TaxID=1872138 RepID=UPI002D7F1764|nr:CU044_5270 family protein [Actinophytocola sp.]HET9139436.1 CU044_5270 family protein [Actinophytocola sp.]
MDDIALLRDIAAETPLPNAGDLAPARARLLSEIAAGVRRPPRRGRRLVLAGAAGAGLAAAITGVIALGGLEQVGVGPAPASAAEILHRAADATRALPDTPPRPDQFVYTRTHYGDGSIREDWRSADGTRDGLIVERDERIPLPGCRDGQAQVIKGTQPVPGVVEPCQPDPAYRADLPTDAAGMREYLTNAGGKPGDINGFGKNILFLFGTSYVAPPSRAAVFDLVAEVDGLEVVENVTDRAGRPGVGVRWAQRSGRPITLVFDPRTHIYLGTTDTDAVVEQAVVDTAGARP